MGKPFAPIPAVVAAAGLLAAVGGCAPLHAAPTGDRAVTVESSGLPRQYLIHEPSSPGPGRRPAVLIFHGGGGTAENMAATTGFDALADTEGFVAVYPVGSDKSWNDGRGADTTAGAKRIDDIAFVSAIIDRLVADNDVDPTRVYATGLSNGAMFTEYLGCRLSAGIAAIAPVAGPLPAADAADCAPTHPLPVLEIHGTADPVVPYDGGVVRMTSGRLGPGTSPVLSVDATQQLWRSKNRCGPVTTAELPTVVDDGTTVHTATAACADNTRVAAYSIDNGGHTWPGGPQYLPAALVGKVSRQFDAATVIWQFFSGR
ncbi:esterase [Nocardia nova]|uniref:extracellular catalytic domain type 1 short-chain-length polyhydroxyalkanoate depolymerase n=1 Tax=Nocardia nova TaxID=37330 RepID=UPI000CE9FB67|nr:PHB depolymerase family esterase [Nocardia nova]PPI93665.1 esterase [Nocardia nova]PPJ14008.1 esterase [Nocardia nova]